LPVEITIRMPLQQGFSLNIGCHFRMLA